MAAVIYLFTFEIQIDLWSKAKIRGVSLFIVSEREAHEMCRVQPERHV